jgi:hypothetical protein
MRGKFLHNQVMIAALVSALRLRRYHLYLEHPVRRGKYPPSADIFFKVNGGWVVIEVERTTARITNDFKKAQALQADLLLLVMPDAQKVQAAKTVVRCFAQKITSPSPRILVMTLGAALQWVANNCPIMSARIVTSDI